VRRQIDRLVARADRTAAWGTRVLAGRGIRRAWLVVACITGPLILVGGTYQVATVLAHEERTVVAEYPAAGLDRLVVDNEAGSVTVVGVDGADTVRVHARISDGLRSTGHRVTEQVAEILVEGTCPLIGSQWCEVDYTIEVPADLHVAVDGHESITISDVDAGLDAHSVAGTVELARVSGDVTVSANQGRLEATDLRSGRVAADVNQGRVRLEFAASPRRVDVDADQGRVEIVLPDDEGVFYALETESDQGSVSDSIRQDPDSARSIRVEADQGSITITYPS
jgi:hypothetical protein